MKAALLKKLKSPLVVEDVPRPEIGPDEVLIETRCCGICRTDLHIQDGLAYVPRLPHIPGHEPAGVVVEIGSQVSEVQIGQRVVPHLFVNGGDCFYTRSGQHAQAMQLEGIIGVTLPGGFAEYFVAPARNLLVLPDNVPFEIGGLVSCAAITAVHAFRKSGVGKNDSAVVLGVGGVGLMIVQLLSHVGVRTVAVDQSAGSLKLAADAGAELTISSDTSDAAERIREFTGGDRDGVDCLFEMVGTAGTMQAAAGYVRRGGRIVVIGEEAEYPAIDSITIAQRELEIVGSRNGGMQDARDAIEMMSTGILRPHIAARFPLQDINDALNHVRHGEAHGRVVISVRE